MSGNVDDGGVGDAPRVVGHSLNLFEGLALERHVRKPATIVERIRPDVRNAVANRHVRKTSAIAERTLTDARYAVGNRQARQVTAAVERRKPDARDAIWNRHARHSSTR